jgi:AmmeMemoRadiSam system protein B
MASNINFPILQQILIRTPLCYYYSSQKSECLKEIISSYLHRLGPGQLPSERSTAHSNDTTSFIPCMLVPHGAYCDSGPLYAQAYYWINSFIFDTALIIGTNHCGAGSSNVSLSPDNWQTPFGIQEIDTDLFNTLVSVLGNQTIDREAHRKEHSIENQIPFLKHLRPQTKFVALSFSRLNDLNQGYQVCEQIKKAINLYQQQTGIKNYVLISIQSNELKIFLGKQLVIISTTDYTHYGPGYGQIQAQNLLENEEYARTNDKPILQSILSNNPEQLLQTQWRTQNSMCGLWPSLIIMILSKILNHNKGQWNLLCYHVSSEVMKRGKDVCGFASLVYSNTL